MKSIQTKFTVLILGCIFFTAAIIGGAGILTAQHVVDDNSAKIMNLLCSEKAREINALLSRIEQSVRTLAAYTTGRLESVERLSADSEYLRHYTQILSEAAVNAASNTEGALAVYVRFNPELAPPTSGLFWSKTALEGNFKPLPPTDFSSYSPADLEHLGWYYLPVKNGKPTWIDPYLNKNINVTMISFVIPIYVNYQVVGVVGMDINFSVITDIVKNTQIYQSGYAFLVDESSKLVYHRVLKAGMPLSSFDPSLRALGTEIYNGTSASALSAYSYNGEEKKMAIRPLGNGMRLAITSPVSEIDAIKNTLISQIAIALLFITTVSIFLTVFMTGRLIRPLRELNDAAKKIAGGDLSINISRQTTDEVGTLAESFQLTVEHLQKYIGYINGLAYRDSLTGVKNKTAYLEAEAQLEEKMRTGMPEFALMVLDINGLKQVNDTYGHDFGDMLIINACRLICKAFIHSPVYRIGGDEFVVILEKGDYDHYQELLEQFQTEIDLYNKNARADCQVSIARGTAVYNSETDLVFANLFKRADDAMYQNKATMKAQQRLAEEVDKAVKQADA